MRYLVASKSAAGHLPAGCRIIADGEMISFEQPWSFGAPLLASIGDDVDIDDLKARANAAGFNAFVVEGLEAPGSGRASYCVDSPPS